DVEDPDPEPGHRTLLERPSLSAGPDAGDEVQPAPGGLVRRRAGRSAGLQARSRLPAPGTARPAGAGADPVRLLDPAREGPGDDADRGCADRMEGKRQPVDSGRRTGARP